jgi:cytoskeletal protein CcmA (bactofilin family)
VDMFRSRAREGRREAEEQRWRPESNQGETETLVSRTFATSRVVRPDEALGLEPGQSAQRAVPTAPENCATVISAGSALQGSLRTDGSVRIDGQLAGEVYAEDTVHISEGAQVDAKVEATFVVIAGAFQGQVRCRERLELLPTSRIKGEFTMKLLTVHEGAFIDGQLRMAAPEEQAAATGRSFQSGRLRSTGTRGPSEDASAPSGGESSSVPSSVSSDTADRGSASG